MGTKTKMHFIKPTLISLSLCLISSSVEVATAKQQTLRGGPNNADLDNANISKEDSFQMDPRSRPNEAADQGQQGQGETSIPHPPQIDSMQQVLESEDVDPTRSRSPSNYGTEDITVYSGNWGGWKSWQQIPYKGYYACGAELRVEDKQGLGDDSAANGLKLRFCNYDQWNKQLQDVMVYPGKWGSWKGMVMCPRGRYIAGARVRYEDPVGAGDDSALNGLSIWCVSKDFRYGDVEVVHNGSWGSWKPWAYRSKKFVTGAEVRFEDHQGGGDDTAMNGLKMRLEYPKAHC